MLSLSDLCPTQCTTGFLEKAALLVPGFALGLGEGFDAMSGTLSFRSLCQASSVFRAVSRTPTGTWFRLSVTQREDITCDHVCVSDIAIRLLPCH